MGGVPVMTSPWTPVTSVGREKLGLECLRGALGWSQSGFSHSSDTPPFTL